jgi:uncharacterized membrane protein
MLAGFSRIAAALAIAIASAAALAQVIPPGGQPGWERERFTQPPVPRAHAYFILLVRRLHAAGLALVLLFAVPMLAHAQTFQGLGSLPGLPSVGVTSPRISADGTGVVGSVCCNAEGGSQAFQLNFNKVTNVAGAMFAIAHTPLADTSTHLTSSFAAGVSDPNAGTPVIVGSGSVYRPPYPGNQTNEAFRWTAANGMVGLGFLAGRGVEGAGSKANGVNAGIWDSINGVTITGGSVVVGSSDTTPINQVGGVIIQAFRWTAASGMVGLGFLPRDSVSGAYAVSADGLVTVGGSCASGSPTSVCQPFRWTSLQGITGLGFIPGYFTSAAYDVNADGSVIVGPACNLTNVQICQAFRWTASTGMVALGSGIAYAVDAAGDVVVGSVMNNQGGEVDAFVWTITGTQSLTSILTAHGVNLSGTLLAASCGRTRHRRIADGSGRSQRGKILTRLKLMETYHWPA